MRKRLNAFIEFAKTILPHEIDYLIGINQLKDKDRLAILEQIKENIQQSPPAEKYDLSIDKRTYSHLKNWIQKQLSKVDVDDFFQWISEIDLKIVTGSIEPEEERRFLKLIREYEAPGFYFTRFFEVLQHYADFLLIRLRYKDHQFVDDRLKAYRMSYLRHKEIQETLREASSEIVLQYNQPGGLPKWKPWLAEIFADNRVQGYFRYQALVRLHFMDLQAPQNQELLERYAIMGEYFAQGKYYSRRLLVNYYHNVMLLHRTDRNFSKALHFGYLSTRVANHDLLLHVNNLCEVLVNLDRYEEGLVLLRSVGKEARNTNNFFNRVGYISFYMRCLIGTGSPSAAASFGTSFLAVYKKEIMKYRWFRFFSTYLEALLRAEKFGEAIKVCRKHRLLDLEGKRNKKGESMPRIAISYYLAQFLAGDLSQHAFTQHLSQVGEKAKEKLLRGDLSVFTDH